MAVNNFDVLDEMAKNDMDISLCTTLVKGQLTKRGGEITMGVSPAKAQEVLLNPNKYYYALYIINADQFKATEQRLSGAEAQTDRVS